jgi:hypothetical protein
VVRLGVRSFVCLFVVLLFRLLFCLLFCSFVLSFCCFVCCFVRLFCPLVRPRARLFACLFVEARPPNAEGSLLTLATPRHAVPCRAMPCHAMPEGCASLCRACRRWATCAARVPEPSIAVPAAAASHAGAADAAAPAAARLGDRDRRALGDRRMDDLHGRRAGECAQASRGQARLPQAHACRVWVTGRRSLCAQPRRARALARPPHGRQSGNGARGQRPHLDAPACRDATDRRPR